MGILTLADFQEELTDSLGRVVDIARLTRWINLSLLEVGPSFKFPELEAVYEFDTAIGENVYSGPANYRAIHQSGMWIVSPADKKGKLISEDRVQYMRKFNFDTGDGSTYALPRYYHMYQREIWLRPVPDAVYTISVNYWTKVQKFVSATDTSQLPDDWDDVILMGALYRGYRAYGEFDRYQNVRNDFLALIRSRVMQDELEEFPEGGISLAQSEDDMVNE